MKIAEVVSTFPPYRGGVGNVARQNASELQRQGHDVSVFIPRYKSIGKAYKNSPFPVYQLLSFLQYGNASFLPQLFWRLNKYDVIHLHYPFFGGAEAVALRILWNKLWHKKNSNTPKLAITYHMDVVGKGWLKLLFSLYNKIFTPIILNAADKIFFSSLDYAKHSMVKNVLSSKVKIEELPNGVDTEKFRPALKDNGLLQKYRLVQEDKIILFVGGLDRAHYFKGVEGLIEAIGKLKNKSAKLLIVGEGNLKKYYQEKVNILNLSNRVIFAGSISDADLSKYYCLADVFILPSIDRSEAFGLVLTEAMACGKPVIASDLPGVRSVVDRHKNGLLFTPKNINELSSKIDQLLSGKEKALRYGKAGRKKVEEKYSRNAIGKKLAKELTGLFL